MKISLRTPRFALRTPRSGVALIVTLVLLSIITFMAVTFLVVSSAERRSVSTTTDQTIARLTVEAAMERAVAELQASILASTNPFAFDLRVTTNYFSTNGFLKGVAYPTNVAWTYGNGAPLTPSDFQQNIANLLYNPRVPVFMTNLQNGSNEFRYFLDWNRNGMFEETGLFPVVSTNGLFYNLNSQVWETPVAGRPYLSNSLVGDPQWIGILERPGQPHSPSNYFTARFAYLIAPSGKTLDLNYMHNYAKAFRTDMYFGRGDGFLRDQGVGTYEENLAAFLADLNTNIWTAVTPKVTYPVYYADRGANNAGVAFDDALSLLRYRYGSNYNSLMLLHQNFGTNGRVGNSSGSFSYPYQLDGVDETLSGPIMTNLWWNEVDNQYARWAGSDNTNHFFTPQDLFDLSKTTMGLPPSAASNFTARLKRVGSSTNNYDRYTFYRLLAQLGMDSAPEPPGKINLNYDNVVHTNHYSGATSATNLARWDPTDFFVTTANRLLTNAGYRFGTLSIFHTNLSALQNTDVPTNGIQIWPTNQYTPSIHRLLQLAANIYDARTNRFVMGASNGLGYPSIFRPVFYRNQAQSNAIYIVGYSEVTNVIVPAGNLLRDPTKDNAASLPGDLFYGVPVVVGAKKGWPNFNQFAMQTRVLVTRKLQFIPKTDGSDGNFTTNQKYLLSVTGVLGIEAWNSYRSNFTRPLQMVASVVTESTLSNDVGTVFTHQTYNLFSNSTTGVWPGYQGLSPQSSFVVPLLTNYYVLNTNVYSQPNANDPGTGRFTYYNGDVLFDNPSLFITPRWWLNVRTSVRFTMYDATPGQPGGNRIIDYVNLDSRQDPQQTNFPVEIIYNLMGGQAPGGDTYINYAHRLPNASDNIFWVTNRDIGASGPNVPNWGVLAQIDVGSGRLHLNGSTGNSDWHPFEAVGATDITSATNRFRNLLSGNLIGTNVFYSPFDPVGTIYLNTVWQANDPLVHHTVGDLVEVYTGIGGTNLGIVVNQFRQTDYPTNRLGGRTGLSDRYRPWGRNGNDTVTEPILITQSAFTLTNMGLKDPMVTCSDDWDFPTNSMDFANVGWLGRVHRGTPWQTVYLKAGSADMTNWIYWVGGKSWVTNTGQIATNLLAIWDGKANSSNLGNAIALDALFSHPVNDYHILDLFSTSFSDNMSHGRLSVNQTNLAAWSAVLSGVNVLTNPTSSRYNLGSLFIQPAGVYDWTKTNAALLPPLVRIVNGIYAARTNFANRVFASVGDILNAPELTTNSPFLNLTNTSSLTDAAYERIPQQIFGLLQCDSSPRFVVYAYGQALKPAEHSLVTGGTLSDLCTNYQVTAESAMRAVIRIDNPTSGPRAVIENFNLLGPD